MYKNLIVSAGGTFPTAKANVNKKPELFQLFGSKITARLCQCGAQGARGLRKRVRPASF